MIAARGHRAWWPLIVLLAAGWLTGACSSKTPPPESKLTVSWELNPAAPVVGPAVLHVQLQNPSGQMATGGTVRVEAMMSHAGMAPVTANATERTPGFYEVPLTFTMQGDWILLVSGVLPDGRRVEQRVDVTNVRPAK